MSFRASGGGISVGARRKLLKQASKACKAKHWRFLLAIPPQRPDRLVEMTYFLMRFKDKLVQASRLKSNTRVISNERQRNERRGEEKTYKKGIDGMQDKTFKVSPCHSNAKAWQACSAHGNHFLNRILRLYQIYWSNNIYSVTANILIKARS